MKKLLEEFFKPVSDFEQRQRVAQLWEDAFWVETECLGDLKDRYDSPTIIYAAGLVEFPIAEVIPDAATVLIDYLQEILKSMPHTTEVGTRYDGSIITHTVGKYKVVAVYAYSFMYIFCNILDFEHVHALIKKEILNV